MNIKQVQKSIIFILLLFIGVCTIFSQELDKYFQMDIEDLMNVRVVSATKTLKKISEAPGTIFSITSKEIEEMGARTLSDVLKMATGIQILNRRNGRDMVWIRGITTGYNTKVLLLIDGIPQREAILGEWAPDEEIQLNNIDRIEIIRGPGSALYGGNAYAGVISIFTKDEVEKTRTSIGMGSFNTRRLEFYTGKSFENSKIIVAGNLYETDGHEMDRDRKGKPTNHKDHVEAKNIHVKYLNNNFRIGLTHNDFVTDYPLYAKEKIKPQYFKITHGFADYKFDRNKYIINPKLYLYHGRRYFDYKTRNEAGKLVSAQEQHLESIILGFDGQLTANISENNTFIAGILFEHKNALEFYEELILSSDSDSIDYELENGDALTVPISHPVLWLDKEVRGTSEPGKISTFNYGVYLQDEIRFFKERVNLTLGSRFDEYEGFDAEFSPRAGLVVNISKTLSLKGLIGKAFKPPSYRQKYMVSIQGYSTGNPNIHPERIITYEGELDYHINKNAFISVNYFNNTLTDFIESVAYHPYRNSETERKIQGIECGLKNNYPINSDIIKSISLFSNYSYIDATDILGSTKVEVPSIAKHTFNLGLILRNNCLSFYSGFNFVGQRNKSDSYHSAVKMDEYKEKDNKGPYLIYDTHLSFYKIPYLPIILDISVHNVFNVIHYNPTYDPDTMYDYTKEKRNICLKITTEL